MQFDELCAAFGALRDRVAELEAKEAARAEIEANTVTIKSGVDRWRTLDGKPISAIAAEGVRQAAGPLKATGGHAAPGNYRIGECGPEAIVPAKAEDAPLGTILAGDDGRLYIAGVREPAEGVEASPHIGVSGYF